jgi:hypothetical protein
MFSGCEEIHYDGEKRFRVLVTLQDPQMNFVENINVRVINQYRQEIDENISSGKTNDKGFLALVFPALEVENVLYTIKINDPNGIFEDLEIKNIEKTDFLNFQLDLGTQNLVPRNELVTFVIDANQIDSRRFLKNVTVAGNVYKEKVDFQTNQSFFEFENPIYKLFKNQTITLNYSIEDFNTQPPSIEDYSFEIPIANENIIYYTIDL